MAVSMFASGILAFLFSVFESAAAVVAIVSLLNAISICGWNAVRLAVCVM
jgi:hypothetical protein